MEQSYESDIGESLQMTLHKSYERKIDVRCGDCGVIIEEDL